MENQINSNQFRDEEIVIMSHWDKKNEEWVRTVYPKIGGRLRLAHEDNDNMSITTEIIKYDENIAVVRAVSTIAKGCYPGFGMASTKRDNKIAPDILELAETRAIARSLRFAGYGVEYCSAEEFSHLENGNGNGNTHYSDSAHFRHDDGVFRGKSRLDSENDGAFVLENDHS